MHQSPTALAATFGNLHGGGRGWGKGQLSAIMSHMQGGVREPRNRTSQVIEAVRSGERVTLTVRGDPVADIVPHGERYRWLVSGCKPRWNGLAADPGLQADLNEAIGRTLGGF